MAGKIIWLNGAFGSGKTQTAGELYRRLPGSFVFDPEEFGFWLRKNEPPALRMPDFQNVPLWREVNYKLLARIAEGFGGAVITAGNLEITLESVEDHRVAWAKVRVIESEPDDDSDDEREKGRKTDDRRTEAKSEHSDKEEKNGKY